MRVNLHKFVSLHLLDLGQGQNQGWPTRSVGAPLWVAGARRRSAFFYQGCWEYVAEALLHPKTKRAR